MYISSFARQAQKCLALDSTAAFSKSASAMIGAESAQNAMRLTLQARGLFGNSSHTAANPSFARNPENNEQARHACLDALNAWLKLFPVLQGGPEYLKANLAIAELYSKCAMLFFREFVQAAQLETKKFEGLSFFEKKKALWWLALKFKFYEQALTHTLLARDCKQQEGLHMLAEQSLDDRTMWAYENAHQSARALHQYSDGVIGEKARGVIWGKNTAYKDEMHVYELKVRQMSGRG